MAANTIKIPELHEEEITCIAQGAGISFAGKVAAGIFQYLYILIIARILGGTFFGLFMLGLTIINFASVISRLGLDFGVVRFVSLYNGAGDKARVKGTIVQSLKFTMLASIALAAILYLGAETLSAKFFHKPELGGVIKILSLSIPFFR